MIRLSFDYFLTCMHRYQNKYTHSQVIGSVRYVCDHFKLFSVIVFVIMRQYESFP